MDRRKFLKFLGATPAVVAVGLPVASKASNWVQLPTSAKIRRATVFPQMTATEVVRRNKEYYASFPALHSHEIVMDFETQQSLPRKCLKS